MNQISFNESLRAGGTARRMLGMALVAGSLVGFPAIGQPTQADDGTISEVKEQRYPQANLDAQASAMVKQDTVRITLAAEFSNPLQAKLNEQLSKAMDSVMKEARANEKVRASTGNYRIWPFHDKNGKLTQWQGRGEVVLESTDFAAASALATLLSDRMPIASLEFFVSPQERTRQEQELLKEAVVAFRARAQALTDALGFADYRIRTVDLGGAGAQYAPMRRTSMAMAAEKADVPLEPDMEMITLSVRGSIFLRSPQK